MGLVNLPYELGQIKRRASQVGIEMHGCPQGLLFVGGAGFQRGILADRVENAQKEAEGAKRTLAVRFNGKGTSHLVSLPVPLPTWDGIQAAGKAGGCVRLDGWHREVPGRKDVTLCDLLVVQPEA